MSIDSLGRITTYCGVCLNYSPDKTFPIGGLVDQSLGQVYKCRLLSGSKECYGCTNYKDKNYLTDIENFKNSFLILLKQVTSCSKDQLFSSPLYTNTFNNLIIDKGVKELIKENKIKATYSYSFNGPTYSLPLRDVFLNKINTELEEKNTGIVEVFFSYDCAKYKALVDLSDNNKLLSIYYTNKEEQSYFNLDSSNKLYNLIKQILTEIKVTRFSTRLKLLLIASKRKEGEFNKEFVASVLTQEYHPEMTLMDALHHCVATYQEALEYKQLELAYRGDPLTLLMELLKAPSKKEIFPKSTDTYSLEEYYNSYINYILQQLRLTNIGWCRKELGFD